MHTGAPEEEMADIFGESHSYYLLAFAPADRKADGRYHKIDVKVNRPGVNVRTRRLLRGRDSGRLQQTQRRGS